MSDRPQLEVEDRFLAAMGLKGLQGDDKLAALQTILSVVNAKVGQRVIEGFTDEQAEEFERLSRPGADAEKLVYWLRLNVPDFQQILEEETRKLRNENKSFVDEMMAKSHSHEARAESKD